MNFTLRKDGNADDISEALCDWFEANYHAPAKLSAIPYLRYHALNGAWEFTRFWCPTEYGNMNIAYDISIEDEYLAVLFALVKDSF